MQLQPGQRDADRRPPLRRARSTTSAPPAGRSVVDFSKKLLAELDAIDASKLSRENQVDAADPAQPAALRHLGHRDAAVLGVGSAGLQRPGRRRDLQPDGARVRADAAAPEVGDRAHGEDPGAVRADAREPRPGARAEDPRRDRRQAERRRAQPGRHLHHAATPAQLQGEDRKRLDAAVAGLRKAVAEQQTWLDKTLVPNAKGDFRIGAEAVRREAAVRAEFVAVARGDQAARRSRTQARARRDVRHRAHRAEGQAGRAGDCRTRPTTTQQQAAIEAALELAYADTPGARQGRRRRQADAGRGHRRSCARRTWSPCPTTPVKIILMPEFQRGVVGRVLRFAGPARQGPGHLLRDLADPGRLDATSRSIRSCANTTPA